MSAQAGWYPDPGGGENLYRFWDGNAWSAATSPNPAAPPPTPALGAPPPPVGQSAGATPLGQSAQGYAQGSGYGQGAAHRHGAGYGPGYAGTPTTPKRKTPVGWWLGAAALLVVIVVVAVFVVRGVSGGAFSGDPQGGQGSQDACPSPLAQTQSPIPTPTDGRVHGGPLSYPELGSPWESPQSESRVPFGADVATQEVLVEKNYQPNSNWVASILVGELHAGDGFYTPEQGSKIVVRCILGTFYGNNEVTSDVKVNRGVAIDGHDAWLVESQLSFDIAGLRTKGELLIVAVVSTGITAGLYYASIPDTTPELVQPARDALKNLKVDG